MSPPPDSRVERRPIGRSFSRSRSNNFLTRTLLPGSSPFPLFSTPPQTRRRATRPNSKRRKFAPTRSAAVRRPILCCLLNITRLESFQLDKRYSVIRTANPGHRPLFHNTVVTFVRVEKRIVCLRSFSRRHGKNRDRLSLGGLGIRPPSVHAWAPRSREFLGLTSIPETASEQWAYARSKRVDSFPYNCRTADENLVKLGTRLESVPSSVVASSRIKHRAADSLCLDHSGDGSSTSPSV